MAFGRQTLRLELRSRFGLLVSACFPFEAEAGTLARSHRDLAERGLSTRLLFFKKH